MYLSISEVYLPHLEYTEIAICHGDNVSVLGGVKNERNTSWMVEQLQKLIEDGKSLSELCDYFDEHSNYEELK